MGKYIDDCCKAVVLQHKWTMQIHALLDGCIMCWYMKYIFIIIYTNIINYTSKITKQVNFSYVYQSFNSSGQLKCHLIHQHRHQSLITLNFLPHAGTETISAENLSWFNILLFCLKSKNCFKDVNKLEAIRLLIMPTYPLKWLKPLTLPSLPPSLPPSNVTWFTHVGVHFMYPLGSNAFVSDPLGPKQL